MTKQRFKRSLRKTYWEGKTSSYTDMSAHRETLCCLIQTSQLSRDWKMWDSVQFYHSRKVLFSCWYTQKRGEQICLQPSLLPHFNFRWRKQHCWSSLQCILHPDNCYTAFLVNSWNQRKDRPFLASIISLSLPPLLFYNSSENSPWSNCWALTVNAYSKYCWESPAKHCQQLSVNMFRSCLPATVKSYQMMCPNASTWWLSPHHRPGQKSLPNRSWCQPARSLVFNGDNRNKVRMQFCFRKS